MKTAGPKILVSDHHWIVEPSFKRSACSFSQLEAHWLLRFALKDGGALFDLPGGVDVSDFQNNEVAAPQFAVDRSVEQCEIAMVLSDLKAYSDGPNMFRF